MTKKDFSNLKIGDKVRIKGFMNFTQSPTKNPIAEIVELSTTKAKLRYSSSGQEVWRSFQTIRKDDDTTVFSNFDF